MMPRGIWEDPTPEAALPDRVERLERVTQGYHDVVGEGGLLAGAVGNLDHSADAIATILTRVEGNQRQLIQVQREGRETRGMVRTMKNDASAEKRRMRLIAFITAASIFVISLIAGAALLTYVRAVADADARYRQVSMDICHKRNAQATIMQNYLDGQVKQIKTMKLTPAQRDKYLAEAQQLRGAFPVVDCARLAVEP